MTTLTQLQAMGGVPVSTGGSPMPGQTKTLSQLQSMGGVPISQPAASGSSMGDIVKNTLTGIGNFAKSYYQNAQGDVASAQKNIASDVQGMTPGANPLQSFTHGVMGTLGVLAHTVQGAVAPISSVFQTGVGNINNALGQTVDNSPMAQAIATSKPADIITNVQKTVQNLIKQHPQAAAAGNNLLTILGAMVGGEELPADATQTSADVGAAADAVSSGANAIKSTVSKLLPESTEASTPEQISTTQLQKVADDWASPTEEAGSRFNKAKAILDSDPQVTNSLAELRANPFAHIVDNTYDTADTAEQIRSTIGEKSATQLRPALQMLDMQTPKTPVADLAPSTSGNNIPELDVTKENAVQKLVDQKTAELKIKYPDGMSNINKLDEKIKFDKNGGYNAAKSDSDANNAIANRAMANSLRDNLKATTPKELGLDPFEKQLAKYYRAADYLDALDGKKAPMSIPHQLGRLGVKIASSKILGSLGAGELGSAFGGFQLGGIVDNIIENIVNPGRDAFLKGGNITEPEALSKPGQFIKYMNDKAATSLKLPSPSQTGELITPQGSKPTYDAPIRAGAEGTVEPQAERGVNPNTGIQYVRNPKTGKISIIQK